MIISEIKKQYSLSVLQAGLFGIPFNIIASTIFILSFFSQCANVVAPSGGPKDIAPPEIKFSYPKNYAINFNTSSIVLEFNEYVSLNNPAAEVLISPPLEKDPEFRLKKKSLIIDLNNDLKPNTTYTINMGSAIKDITEGNVMKDFRFVFSTGNYIDSLKISGQVKNAKSNKAAEDVLVMLYKGTDDSMPYKIMPNYLSKADKQGNYKIENVSQGTYLLFALKDQNGNRLYDLPNEQIAYLDNVNINDSINTKDLRLFEEIQSPKLMEAYSKEIGKVIFVFSGKTEFVKVLALEKKTDSIVFYNFMRDTAIYWTNNISDSIKTFIVLNKNIPFDTVEVEMKILAKDKDLQKVYPLTLSAPKETILPKPLLLEWSQPLFFLNQDSIYLYEDTFSVELDFEIRLIDSPTNKRIQIDYPWQAKKTYVLSFDSATAKNMYSIANDSFGYSFKTYELDKLANLNMTFDIKEELFALPLVFYIKDNAGKVLFKQNIPESKEIILSKFLPGEYFLEVLVDENNNGRWDRGNYLQHKQAEKIYFYSEKIKLRANWDMDLTFKLR